MPDYLNEAKNNLEYTSAVRKAIHSNPELGRLEYKTADLIEKELVSFGVKTTRIASTGVLGVLEGAFPGKTVAFRADIDALPVTEETGSDFASKNVGVMHACGHDVHTAALLGAAKLLSFHKNEIHGKVVFIFESDEEGSGTAKEFVNTGCLEGASAVFGIHVSPSLPSGCVGIKYGKFYAASDMFDVVFHGLLSHGAEPENGKDALFAACLAVSEMKKIPEKYTDKCVVTTGTIHSGTARNIISDKAEISGIVRTLGAENRLSVCSDVKDVINRACEKSGCTCDIKFTKSYGGVVNDNMSAEYAKSVAESVLGKESVMIISEPTMTTEDFGVYLENTPGCFCHIGAGCCEGLHNSKFIPDEIALLTASALHFSLAGNMLGL